MVTIKVLMQGTRFKSESSYAVAFSEAVKRIKDGGETGEESDDDYGYRFLVSEDKHSSVGPVARPFDDPPNHQWVEHAYPLRAVVLAVTGETRDGALSRLLALGADASDFYAKRVSSEHDSASVTWQTIDDPSGSYFPNGCSYR